MKRKPFFLAPYERLIGGKREILPAPLLYFSFRPVEKQGENEASPRNKKAKQGGTAPS
jgi:hypothetical protein